MTDGHMQRVLISFYAPYQCALYCLISVDHDDLPDGGSGHFVETVRAMKHKSKPEMMAECLTSDFQGDLEAVSMLANSGLDIFAHNIETVNASREIYEQSLSVLKPAELSTEGMITKTSIMLGLGETNDELMEAMAHLCVHVQCMFEHYYHILKKYIHPPYSCITFRTMNIIFLTHRNLILMREPKRLHRFDQQADRGGTICS
ncbi:plastid lipoate synthase 1 [Artemisia annua]|uniref:Plastid lipoate synthase 1 n=1 Tax=Artemisia annua TaxID=35608 RepID=A0A2U1LT48_ARTAN|nr:plastid lipoate synthase 1 [Artemisia annua]